MSDTHHTRHDALTAHCVDAVLVALDAELRTVRASVVDQLIDHADAMNLIRHALDRAAGALLDAVTDGAPA